jgi:hypothetical protein
MREALVVTRCDPHWPLRQLCGLEGLHVSIEKLGDLGSVRRTDLTRRHRCKHRRDRSSGILGISNRWHFKGDRPILLRRNNAIKANAKCWDVACLGKLDRLPGEDFNLAVQERFESPRNFVSRALGLAGGVTFVSALNLQFRGH